MTGTPNYAFQSTKPYKFIVAVLGAVIVAIAAALSDSEISNAEWAQVIIAGSTALTVWVSANLPTFGYAKFIVAIVGALANLGVAWVTGETITTAEWWNLGIVGLTALGVFAVPNPGPAVPAAPAAPA